MHGKYLGGCACLMQGTRVWGPAGTYSSASSSFGAELRIKLLGCSLRLGIEQCYSESEILARTWNAFGKRLIRPNIRPPP
jgi:hypothetical protein